MLQERSPIEVQGQFGSFGKCVNTNIFRFLFVFVRLSELGVTRRRFIFVFEAISAQLFSEKGPPRVKSICQVSKDITTFPLFPPSSFPVESQGHKDGVSTHIRT